MCARVNVCVCMCVCVCLTGSWFLANGHDEAKGV